MAANLGPCSHCWYLYLPGDKLGACLWVLQLRHHFEAVESKARSCSLLLSLSFASLLCAHLEEFCITNSLLYHSQPINTPQRYSVRAVSSLRVNLKQLSRSFRSVHRVRAAKMTCDTFKIRNVLPYAKQGYSKILSWSFRRRLTRQVASCCTLSRAL